MLTGEQVRERRRIEASRGYIKNPSTGLYEYGGRGLSGLGSLWTPRQLTSIALDLDARYINNLSGATQTAFDQSGRSNDFVAPLAANRMPWNASGFNGGSKPYWAPLSSGPHYLHKTSFSWGGSVGALSLIFLGRVVTQGVATCWGAYGAANRPAWLLGPGAAYQFFQLLAATASSFTTTQNNLIRMWWLRWNGSVVQCGQNLTQEDNDADASGALADGGTFAFNATSSGAASSTSIFTRVLATRAYITNTELALLYGYFQREGYGI